MKAIVLAGGLGMRLRDKVPNLPKPMAPVAGRPFLEYVLDKLIAGGITEVTLSVGYQSKSIIDYFGDAYRDLALSYAVESEPLGTGGAILHALDENSNAPVLVTNGDTFLNIDYGHLINWYLENQVKVALVLKEVHDVSRYGSVMLSGENIIGFEEKGKHGPGLINAGVYIIKPCVLRKFGYLGKFSFETDLLQEQYALLAMKAYVTDAYFIDIGIPKDYQIAQIDLPTFI